MATFTGKLKQKTGASSYDILHPETEAGVVSYDHTSSGLLATTVQGAIDEIVSSGVGVTGVKGDAESTYRTGQVNLTSANIGAEPAFTDGSATIASVSSNIVTLKAGVTQSGGAIANSTGSDITLAKVAKTGAYSDLSGTPTIGDGTLTIQTEGTTKGTFTANQTGPATINITAADLGLTSALKFIGVGTTTQPSAGQYIYFPSDPPYYVRVTTTGAAEAVTAHRGDVIIIGDKEYLCTEEGVGQVATWEELGDESSFALKTVTISAGTGLTGGGSLAANRTISLADHYGDTKNPYASKTKNFVLAAPATANGVPSFRKLLTSDLITGSGGGTMGLGSLMYGDADGSELVALNIGAAGKVLKSNGYTPEWADDTNQTITLSGDATGSGTTAIAVTLANTGVTAGTYSAVTVNTKGLVTAGGQVLEVISNGATPTVVNGGWYFEKDA